MVPRTFLLPRIGVGGLLVLLTGCSPHPSAAPAPLQNSPLKITLQLTPPKPRQLDPILLTVYVKDLRGRPVSAAVMQTNLAMPSMDMGRNSVVMNAVEPGTYGGTGRFTMAGSWQVTVCAVSGKDRVSQSFPVDVQ